VGGCPNFHSTGMPKMRQGGKRVKGAVFPAPTESTRGKKESGSQWELSQRTRGAKVTKKNLALG